MSSYLDLTKNEFLSVVVSPLSVSSWVQNSFFMDLFYKKKNTHFFRGAIFYKDSQYLGLVLLNKHQLFRSIFNKNNLIRVTILNGSLLIPFSIFYLNH